jgi:hypothetical protein
MILIIFIILFISIILIYFINNYLNYETFSECNNFYKNSFCQLDVNTNKCVCKFQKDENKYGFDSLEGCCDICSEIDTEDCLADIESKKISYYCNIGGKCKEYKGSIINSHISANNCGNDPLNNQLLLPYTTFEECSKSINICDKYNDPTKSIHINKEECLKNSNCGYCTNDSNSGKCIEGNATSPLDLSKYYYCNPNTNLEINKYEYGNHAKYII